MTGEQAFELIPYACIGLALLLMGGSLTYMYWRHDHPRKSKTVRTGGGLLE